VQRAAEEDHVLRHPISSASSLVAGTEKKGIVFVKEMVK
jgi:hypothetical protein